MSCPSASRRSPTPSVSLRCRSRAPIVADELSFITERVNTVLRTVPDGVEKLALWQGVDYLVLPELDEPAALDLAFEQLSHSTARLPLIASGRTDAREREGRRPASAGLRRRGSERRRECAGVKDPVKLGEFIANARWAYENSYVERDYNEWSV